jgi:hypothetical protein
MGSNYNGLVRKARCMKRIGNSIVKLWRKKWSNIIDTISLRAWLLNTHSMLEKKSPLLGEKKQENLFHNLHQSEGRNSKGCQTRVGPKDIQPCLYTWYVSDVHPLNSHIRFCSIAFNNDHMSHVTCQDSLYVTVPLPQSTKIKSSKHSTYILPREWLANNIVLVSHAKEQKII